MNIQSHLVPATKQPFLVILHIISLALSFFKSTALTILFPNVCILSTASFIGLAIFLTKVSFNASLVSSIAFLNATLFVASSLTAAFPLFALILSYSNHSKTSEKSPFHKASLPPCPATQSQLYNPQLPHLVNPQLFQ